MPQFHYAISGKVEDLVKDEKAFRPLGAQIRKNIESVLRDYEIKDAATRRDLLGVLATLDVLESRDAAARKKLDEIRSLEEKPAAKLMGGRLDWTMRAILDARRQTNDRTSSAYRQAVYASMKRALESAPYEVVQNDIKAAKASLEMTSESFMIGRLRSSFDPIAAKTGGLSSNLAHALPGMRWGLVEGIPLKATFLGALDSYLAAHTTEKENIWTARNMDLEPGKNYALVKVAVWDRGVDAAIFRDRLVQLPNGQPAVIAFDRNFRKTTGVLSPLTEEQALRYPEAIKHMKGMADMRANVETPEAVELRRVMGALKPDQLLPFEELSLFGTYVHGTHVAGILMAGNPYARLAVARSSGEYNKTRETCPSAERMQLAGRANQAFVDFFKSQGVRVVNMSWRGEVKGTEDALEECGIGKPGEDRHQTARRWFDIWKNALEESLRAAPEILFIAGAGNSNSDAGFTGGAPGGLRMPNLLTVGAVDMAGRETSFTGYGPAVAVHADGYEVESYIPGGTRLKLSGTSMAAPNVANLAAKILAVNPKLSAPEVIALIRKTADKSEDGRRNLIHPKNAVAAATTRFGIE